MNESTLQKLESQLIPRRNNKTAKDTVDLIYKNKQSDRQLLAQIFISELLKEMQNEESVEIVVDFLSKVRDGITEKDWEKKRNEELTQKILRPN